MFEDGPNPSLVQSLALSKLSNPPLPLVFIHDSGGTTFGYFTLGNLDREFWAIHDPHYWNSAPWEGGVEEITDHYIELMAEAGIKGNILLGGWSLGGYISLAIARKLADNTLSKISVVGLLFIDCPYHEPRPSTLQPSTDSSSDDSILSDIQMTVTKAFNTEDILEDWELPQWDLPACKGNKVHIQVSNTNFTLESGTILHKPLNESWKITPIRKSQNQETHNKAVAPPPCAMLRCIRRVPVREEEHCEPCFIDKFRDETLLGWETNHVDFIKAIIDVDSNHYSVFNIYDDAKTEDLTARLIDGLEILDSLNQK